eukprot:11193941-Lingulodinium_polyedra.AAC.1
MAHNPAVGQIAKLGVLDHVKTQTNGMDPLAAINSSKYCWTSPARLWPLKRCKTNRQKPRRGAWGQTGANLPL